MNRRKCMRLPVRLLLDQYCGEEHQVCFSVDLSPDGICLYQKQQALPVGSHVQLELTLPGHDDSIWAAGRLCSVQQADPFPVVSIAFTALAETHRNQIHDWALHDRMRQLRQAMRSVRRAAPPFAAHLCWG